MSERERVTYDYVEVPEFYDDVDALLMLLLKELSNNLHSSLLPIVIRLTEIHKTIGQLRRAEHNPEVQIELLALETQVKELALKIRVINIIIQNGFRLIEYMNLPSKSHLSDEQIVNLHFTCFTIVDALCTQIIDLKDTLITGFVIPAKKYKHISSEVNQVFLQLKKVWQELIDLLNVQYLSHKPISEASKKQFDIKAFRNGDVRWYLENIEVIFQYLAGETVTKSSDQQNLQEFKNLILFSWSLIFVVRKEWRQDLLDEEVALSTSLGVEPVSVGIAFQWLNDYLDNVITLVSNVYTKWERESKAKKPVNNDTSEVQMYRKIVASFAVGSFDKPEYATACGIINYESLWQVLRIVSDPKILSLLVQRFETRIDMVQKPNEWLKPAKPQIGSELDFETAAALFKIASELKSGIEINYEELTTLFSCQIDKITLTKNGNQVRINIFSGKNMYWLEITYSSKSDITNGSKVEWSCTTPITTPDSSAFIPTINGIFVNIAQQLKKLKEQSVKKTVISNNAFSDQSNGSILKGKPKTQAEKDADKASKTGCIETTGGNEDGVQENIKAPVVIKHILLNTRQVYDLCKDLRLDDKARKQLVNKIKSHFEKSESFWKDTIRLELTIDLFRVYLGDFRVILKMASTKEGEISWTVVKIEWRKNVYKGDNVQQLGKSFSD